MAGAHLREETSGRPKLSLIIPFHACVNGPESPQNWALVAPVKCNGEGGTEGSFLSSSTPNISPTNQSSDALILTTSLHSAGAALYPVHTETTTRRVQLCDKKAEQGAVCSLSHR